MRDWVKEWNDTPIKIQLKYYPSAAITSVEFCYSYFRKKYDIPDSILHGADEKKILTNLVIRFCKIIRDSDQSLYNSLLEDLGLQEYKE